MESTEPDQATSQLKETQIVLEILVVAYEQGPTFGQPIFGAFHNPAAWFVSFLDVPGFLLFANASHVSRIAGVVHRCGSRGVVIGLIQTEVLRFCCCRFG